MAEVSVRGLAASELELVRELWEALLEHHAAMAPQMPPVRAAADSWARRRADYERWLAAPDAFALLAEAEGYAVGYTVVAVRGPDETWTTSDRVAEIETLVVAPSWRGRGVGGMLLDAAEERIAAAGIGDFFVAAVAGNEGAIRFYERRGLVRSTVVFFGRS